MSGLGTENRWSPINFGKLNDQFLFCLEFKPPSNVYERDLKSFCKDMYFSSSTPNSDYQLLSQGLSEKAMAPYSSTLACTIPWMEEPGRLQSMGLLRVKHDWVTSLSLFTFMHWRRKWQPTPVFLPGESQGRGSLVAAVYRVAQNQTRLKQLSSSSKPGTLATLQFWCF